MKINNQLKLLRLLPNENGEVIVLGTAYNCLNWPQLNKRKSMRRESDASVIIQQVSLRVIP